MDFPLLDAAPDQSLTILASHQVLAYLWKWIVDWGAVITLVILSLARKERLKAGSPTLLAAAVVFGFLWAGPTIGTSDLMLHNFGIVADLHGSAPAQAAAWTVLARSLWVLLLRLATLRMGGLTRTIGHLGVFPGIAGSLTMIPPLAEVMFMIFGPG